jgi:hypothetical protein
LRFERDRDGSWLIDPDDLARHLGLSSGYLQRQMSLGRVTSRVEAGSGEDEGRHRVTVRLAAVAWQGIFDVGGRLVSEQRLP